MSFEALSRGAAEAVLVDRDPEALGQIAQSARELGLQACIRTARIDLLGDPTTAVRKLPGAVNGFDLVFVDAPYSAIDRIPALLDEIVEAGAVAPGAWIVVEHPTAFDWRWPNGLAPEAEYRYGQTGISLGIRPLEKGTP